MDIFVAHQAQDGDSCHQLRDFRDDRFDTSFRWAADCCGTLHFEVLVRAAIIKLLGGELLSCTLRMVTTSLIRMVLPTSLSAEKRRTSSYASKTRQCSEKHVQILSALVRRKRVGHEVQESLSAQSKGGVIAVNSHNSEDWGSWPVLQHSRLGPPGSSEKSSATDPLLSLRTLPCPSSSGGVPCSGKVSWNWIQNRSIPSRRLAVSRTSASQLVRGRVLLLD